MRASDGLCMAQTRAILLGKWIYSTEADTVGKYVYVFYRFGHLFKNTVVTIFYSYFIKITEVWNVLNDLSHSLITVFGPLI
jgi:hypothetical protein